MLLGIFSIGYLAIGIITALVIFVSDLTKKKSRGLGVLLDIASLHVFGFVIFAALWPLWLAILWHGEEVEENSGQKVPDKTQSVDKDPKD